MTRAEIQKHTDELCVALDAMHKAAAATSAIKRTMRRQQQKYRQTPNFGIGDYVLVGVPEPAKMTGRKLILQWHGPYRVTETKANYVFEVENIINQSKR